MPTQTDLRDALHSAARTATPLEAGDVLHRAKCRRSRRRLLAMTGVSTGALAVTAVVLLTPVHGRTGRVEAIATIPVTATSAVAAGPAENLDLKSLVGSVATGGSGLPKNFTVYESSRNEDGDFELLMKSVDEHNTIAIMNRHAGVTKLPEWTGGEGRTLRTIQAGDIDVQVLEWNKDGTRIQQVQWLAKGARYTIYSHLGRAGKPIDGLTDAGIRKLVPLLVGTGFHR
jgi:hypothetical protein